MSGCDFRLDLAYANLGLLFPRITACDGDGLRPHCTNDNWGYLRLMCINAPRLRLPSTKSLVVGYQAFSAKPNANRHQSATFTPDRLSLFCHSLLRIILVAQQATKQISTLVVVKLAHLNQLPIMQSHFYPLSFVKGLKRGNLARPANRRFCHVRYDLIPHPAPRGECEGFSSRENQFTTEE